MFETSSLMLLIVIFSIASCVVWYAGIKLTRTVEIIDKHFDLGQAVGGMIFLAIVNNLPEIAIVVSASIMNNVEMAIGNLLGGIAIRTLVLTFLDAFVLKDKASLTYNAASLQVVVEGVLLICILGITIMGTQLPKSLVFLHVAPGDVLILTSWLIGLWLVNKARTHLPWHQKGRAPDTSPPAKKLKDEKQSIPWTISFFVLLAFLTFLGGIALEESSRMIATQLGFSSSLFGATVLAAATALPEISTGYEAVKMRDYNLVFSDIFGSNAFLPVLFIFVTLLTGQSALSQVKNTDIYLTCLGILLTAVYIFGLIFRPKKQIFYLGIDSAIVLLLYIVGMIGLFQIGR